MRHFTAGLATYDLLKHFFVNKLCRLYTGEPGAISDEKFEAKVLLLDRQTHPPISDLPAEHQLLLRRALVLSTYFIMEAIGPVTVQRERLALEHLEMDASTLEELKAVYEAWTESVGASRDEMD